MRLFSSIQTIGRSLAELVYPAQCAACDEPCADNQTFCECCARSVEPIAHSCTACGFALVRPAPRCLRCLTLTWSFQSAHSGFLYGGALAEAIRKLKWTGRYPIARSLGREFSNRAPAFTADLILPVPLHPQRLRERGYNQAALLALALGRRRGPQTNVRALKRIFATAPQSELPLDKRRDNVKSAFHCSGAVRGQRVVLVDDVMTSGATLEACARAVRQAGAVDVIALTLARAMP